MSWAICVFWETKRPGAGLVGRAEDVAGCTDASSGAGAPGGSTALRLAAAGGHTAPVVQTDLQRFSLAGRGAGRQLEPRLVSTPSAACCCCTLPHVAQGRSRCHHACCPHGSALASLNWPLSAAPTVFRHFLGSRERLPHSSGSKLERLGLIDRGVLSLSTPGIWSGCQMKPN